MDSNRQKSVFELPESKKSVFQSAVYIDAGTHQTGSREKGCYAPEEADLIAFYMWPTEVSGSWWSAFKTNDSSHSNDDYPATGVSYNDAVAFCRWFSGRFDVHARLPTRQEWEVAARAGKSGVTYSWGWEQKTEMSPVSQPVHSGKSNPWGLYHMSGNVAEWCAAVEDQETVPVMGGSWAENDPAYHRISHKLTLPKDYRDADAGFRIVIEVPEL